jgi:sugar O-acyltransferase (sialic acid O-acetyltransferase NeuD family)|tara:strand:+ start:3332 stop:3976 length:645 start_codon:yes stop_codon:yes gene_type:complete
MVKKILIFSAGSAGREVYQLISSINKIKQIWEVIGYVDNNKSKIGKTIDNLNVYSNSNKPKNKDVYAICGIMNGSIRKKIFSKEIIKDNYKIENLIHPSVEIPKSLNIGFGNIIFGNVHISFDVKIKNFSIISNYCDLGHNLIAHDYLTVMPSAVIGGNCEIGEQSLIGSGAMIHQNLKIGSNCKIGMGTLVTNEVKRNTSAVDFPRKIIKENS